MSRDVQFGINIKLGGAQTVTQATNALEQSIRQTEARYRELAASGKLSMKQQAAAAVAMREKVAKSREEIEKLQSTVGNTAVGKYAQNMEARRSLGVRSEKDIQKEIAQTEAAYQRLARSGVVSARELARAQDASIAKVRELRMEMGDLTKMQKLQSVGQKYMPLAGGLAAGGAVGYGVTRAFVNKSAEQEMAFTELRISMTDKDNKVSGNYLKALEIATELGNELPGNTRDFVLEAQALKQMGITESVIVNGGLKAAGNLRAGMEMHGEGEAGELVAQEMHTFGLKDHELSAAADQTYRMNKSYGLTASEIKYANTYSGGTMNMLGWQGLENMKDVQAMQGWMKMKGQESSVFGTHFADLLQGAALNKTKLKGKGAITNEVNETLSKYGIKLEFFDKEGKFLQPRAFAKELEKLRTKDDGGKLGQAEQLEVFKKLFGIASDTAVQIAKGGLDGLKSAREQADNKLSLDAAIDQKGKTFQWKRESLSGSVDNMMAAAGEPIKDSLKPALDKLNDFAGTATTFFQKNPLSATLAVLSASAVAAAGAAGLVSMFLRGGVGLPVRVVNPAMSGSVPPGGVAPGGGTKSSRMMGKFGLAAAVGGAALSSVGDEESAAVRYGSAALSGAGLGAMFGPIGAVIGAAGGLAIQGVMDSLKHTEPKPNESHVKIDLNLPPGATVKSQNIQSLGHTKLFMNTGNIWHGAPG